MFTVFHGYLMDCDLLCVYGCIFQCLCGEGEGVKMGEHHKQKINTLDSMA